MGAWYVRIGLVFGLSALVACAGPEVVEPTDLVDTDEVVDPDADEDGSPASEDCDDADPDRRPGLDEICDGKDNDCNELVDDEAIDATDYWSDGDRDGFGAGDPTPSCETPPDTSTQGGDCNDADPAIHPDADEICDEADVDEDCDGTSDDADDSTLRETMSTWYRDEDRDGFGDPDRTTLACDLAPGRSADNTDCDDQDATKNPDLGCSGAWDGDWDATLEVDVTIPDLGLSETCSPSGRIVVDEASKPAVSAPRGFLCSTTAGSSTVGLEADFVSETRIEGELDVDGELVDFEAEFSSEPDRLRGKGSESITVGGFRVDVSYSLDARPAR